MAEQFLHDAQVGAVLQKVACESVPQNVRADPRRRDAGCGGDRLKSRAKAWRRQMAAVAVRRKQPGPGEDLPAQLQRARA